MNINIKLSKNFMTTFKRLSDTYGEEIAKLNGFGDSQLSYTDFIDNFIDKQTVADASIDGNSNVSHKDIVTLETEMSKPHSKLLAYNKIFYEINKKYGFKTANEWLENEWNGHFYMHDAYSSSFRPYCYAYDIDKLAKEGLYFIKNFNYQPPKHLTTFTDFVGEFVSWNCNRTSGAVGLPSFLIYSYYFWKKDCESNFAINSPEYYRDQEFQRIIYKLNQPYLRAGIQSAFTNFSIFDTSYFIELFGGKQFPDGTYMIDSMYEIMEYQKAFMRVVSKIRSENLMTFPVITFSLLYKDGKFVDEDFAKWCCEHNMKWADSNFFISSDVTSLSNCCRLLSNLKALKNNSYFNSIGGTALEVGSLKVSTINLARIAYESKNAEDYISNLSKYVILDIKALDAVRHIIKRNVEKGLLTNYTNGSISFDSQYNTIGIIGMYETLDKFGMTYKDKFGNTYYTDDGIEFSKKILHTINYIKDKFSETVDYSLNIEAVPGEQAASVLMQKDKLLYPNEKYDLPLYGNQWIPLGVKCTLQEKIRISAILDDACQGGSIAHINIASTFTNFDTAWKMLNEVAQAGVKYFSFNCRISACENNHGFFGETCPKCGGKKVTTYQKVVGFLTPESSYSQKRKEEFRMRDWMDLNAD